MGRGRPRKGRLAKTIRVIVSLDEYEDAGLEMLRRSGESRQDVMRRLLERAIETDLDDYEDRVPTLRLDTRELDERLRQRSESSRHAAADD